MRLFPGRTQCVRNIRRFPQRDASELAELWSKMGRSITGATAVELQSEVLGMLRRWQAYRNQPSRRNDEFFHELLRDAETCDAFSTLVRRTRETTSLASILDNKEAIEKLYDFLKGHMLRDHVPTRIVTLSKALLMVSGFTPAFDSVVLNRVKKSNPHLLACPGVWPFCLYFETMQFVSNEQMVWEEANGPMSELLPSTPIGQVMDRILWRA